MKTKHSNAESSLADEKKRLEIQIREAFSFVSRCDSKVDERSSFFLENLTLFDTSTQKQAVPHLMILILYLGIETVPDGDQLLYFLDGAKLKRDKSGALRPRNSRSQADVQYCESVFSDYSLAQINAIIEWLKFISRGPLFGFLPDVADSCLFYWALKKQNASRAKTNRHRC